ncbi:uncharacterized protein LOC143888353 isoform X2 [Tasmannia lanceolata]|uniref:uncharacterized protein LOC143888353 isoform X2 n=1 Tax=Tasmannia lanceolata TaxID=3420 RepID=UPI004064BCCE
MGYTFYAAVGQEWLLVTKLESQMQSQPGYALPKVKKEQYSFNRSGFPEANKGPDGLNNSGPLKMKNGQDSSSDTGSDSGSPPYFDRSPREPVGIPSLEDNDQDAQSIENPSNQLVLYKPGTSDAGQVMSVPDPTEYQIPSFSSFSAPNPGTRVLPSVGAFTVQCATCFKWRLIPTQEKYEEIRENILQEPFLCATAREWRPDISCDDAPDISQDGSRLWAIDKPNISQPPPGWQRLLRIRGEGSTKFADVYYAAPSGKRLRSMVEVQKYLFENPDFIRAGVSMSQFSFQIPKPLQENYVRKRPSTRVTQQYDGSSLGMPTPLSIEPPEVNPLSWAGPECPELHMGRSRLPDPYYEAPVFPLAPPAKKQKIKIRRPQCPELQLGRSGSPDPNYEEPDFPPLAPPAKKQKIKIRLPECPELQLGRSADPYYEAPDFPPLAPSAKKQKIKIRRPECPELQMGRSRPPDPCHEAPVFPPLDTSVKKQKIKIRRPSKQLYSSSTYIQPHIKIEDHQGKNSTYDL